MRSAEAFKQAMGDYPEDDVLEVLTEAETTIKKLRANRLLLIDFILEEQRKSEAFGIEWLAYNKIINKIYSMVD